MGSDRLRGQAQAEQGCLGDAPGKMELCDWGWDMSLLVSSVAGLHDTLDFDSLDVVHWDTWAAGHPGTLAADLLGTSAVDRLDTWVAEHSEGA